jgi:hypothetical protein
MADFLGCVFDATILQSRAVVIWATRDTEEANGVGVYIPFADISLVISLQPDGRASLKIRSRTFRHHRPYVTREQFLANRSAIRAFSGFRLALPKHVWSSQSWTSCPKMLVEVGIRWDDCAFRLLETCCKVLFCSGVSCSEFRRLRGLESCASDIWHPGVETLC